MPRGCLKGFELLVQKRLLSSHLFLQLAQLCRHGVQADPGLLQLLVRRSDQVAAPVGRLPRIFQLTGGNQIRGITVLAQKVVSMK